jgi:crotonobetaine/carnitine-CoA ligase
MATTSRHGHESVRSVARGTNAPTVVSALREQAQRFPHDPFVITPQDRSITFAEVRRRALGVASGFLAHGVLTGNRVAFMSANRPELVELTLGPPHAGMIVVPINVFLKGEFLAHQLRNSGAAAIVVDRTGLSALTPLLDQLPDLRLLILLDDVQAPPSYRGIVSSYANLTMAADSFQPYAARPLDTFMILYTSGTTGPAKGCMLSHAYMTRVARVMGQALSIGDDDVQICVHPMFHMSGQRDAMLALTSGTPIAVEYRFSAGGFFDRARQLGASYWGGPGITDYLLDQPATRDHRLTRWIGTPFSEDNERVLEQKFGIRSICRMYAQTEANPVAIEDEHARSGSRRTDGHVADDIECQVVDEDDNPLSPGEIGEIVIRPKTPGAIFSGYWADAERTLESWRNMWHHTGDLGRFDPEGRLTFVDRKKDVMRRKGENVSAMELERTLLGCEQIAEVATHAVRVEGSANDDIKACIVVRPGIEFDRAGYAAFVMEHVPHFAVPRFYELLDALPRNPIGRVLKFELRAAGVTENTCDLFALGLVHDRRRD